MEIRKILLPALLALAVACGPEPTKEIPEWGKHGADPADTSSTPTPPAPEPVDTLTYSDALAIETAEADFCGLAVTYSIAATVGKGDSYGLFYEGKYFQGPALPAGGGALMQVIPLPKQSSQAKVNVYLKGAEGTVYSEAATVSVPAQPEPIELGGWQKLSVTGVPSGVDIYHVATTLEGKNLEAWYAVADPSAVEVKIKVPSSAATLENQASGDASTLVLVNGGYFYNGRHTGHAVLSGSQINPVPSVRGSLRSTSPEYNVMYYVTRGTFILDSAGKPYVSWAGTDNQNQTHYYSSPLASVCGEARYGQVNALLPVPELGLKPAAALGAGPVLLYDGQIPLNFTETAKGTEYYRNNFEIMPYDIFGPDVYADRTCVGILPDGKVILFVCDGRIKSSAGVNLLQLARIMKGLGCTYAVNMDGGGSTAMWAGGSRLNSLEKDMNGNTENRPVVSTIGFYQK